MKYLLAAFSFALLVGCATPGVAPVAGESLEPLKSEKIAVSYSLVSKRINYVETLYRVLWLETKASSSDYSGLWGSSEADMTDMAVARLRQQGYSAQAVKGIIDRSVLDAANQELGKDMVAKSAGVHPTVTDAKLPPPAAFFRELKPGGAHAAMLEVQRHALGDHGQAFRLAPEMPLCLADLVQVARDVVAPGAAAGQPDRGSRVLGAAPRGLHFSSLFRSMSIHRAKNSICTPMMMRKASKMAALGERAPTLRRR